LPLPKQKNTPKKNSHNSAVYRLSYRRMVGCALLSERRRGILAVYP